MTAYRLKVAVLAALALFAPGWAPAQGVWLCALSDDAMRLVCVADADPLAPAAGPPRQRTVINGTTFPLDPSRPYTVDLWSPPTDMEPVEHLARATICYLSPGCSVVVTGARWAAYKPAARLTSRTTPPR